jgi:plastocyanin
MFEKAFLKRQPSRGNNQLLVVLIVGAVIIVAVGVYIMNRPMAPKLPIDDQAVQVSDQIVAEGNEATVPVVNDMVNDTNQPTPPTPTDTPSQVKEFTVHGGMFFFKPNEMRVKKGDTVKINFINDEGFHDWVIDEFNARTKQIQAGKSETIEFVADKAGTFEYYCSVGQHRQNGMKGNLIVE